MGEKRPGARFTGRWQRALAAPHVIECVESGELRIAGGPAGRMVVIGHCIASDDLLETGLAEFLRTSSPACVSEWPGCYSVAVLQAHGVALIADPVGQFPIYLSRTGQDVFFGSSASALAAQVNAGLDDVALLVALICPEVKDLIGSRCMFQGVEQLREGHMARIGNGRSELTASRELRADPAVSFAEAAARLRLCLTRAVDVRSANADSLTSDLSGGLDSTSLAFLAARDSSRLPVLTYLNNNRPVADDIAHAGRIVRLATAMDHHLVAGSGEDLPYQDIDVLQDEPHSSAVSMGSTKARLRVAAELGSDMHLIGEGGDVVLSAPAVYLADLRAQRDIARLWRHCLGWARIRNRSPWALLSRAMVVARSGRRGALMDLAGRVAQGRPVGPACWEQDQIGYWSQPHADWLSRSARRDLADHIHTHAAALSTVDEQSAGDIVTLGRLRLQALTQRAVRNAGAQVGVAVHAPYLDTAVVQASLSLSAHRRASVTTPKPLLRAALSGLVPDQVLSRPTKGDYTADAYQGVRRAAPVLKRLLDSPATADHGLVEPGPIRETLARAIQGLPTPWGMLHQWVAVEVWLRNQSGRLA